MHGPLNIKLAIPLKYEISFTLEFELEDKFIKKSKHVADLIIFWIFYTIEVVLDWKLVYILLIIENTTGMTHLKKTSIMALQHLVHLPSVQPAMNRTWGARHEYKRIAIRLPTDATAYFVYLFPLFLPYMFRVLISPSSGVSQTVFYIHPFGSCGVYVAHLRVPVDGFVVVVSLYQSTGTRRWATQTPHEPNGCIYKTAWDIPDDEFVRARNM